MYRQVLRLPMMMTFTYTLLVLLLPVNIHGTFTITSSGDPLKGSTISVECAIPSFTGTAGWINPSFSSVALHSCSSGFCPPSNPTYPQYSFSTTANTFTVTITGATLADDTWTCEHGSPAETGTISLGIKVPPTACTLTKSGETYTCTSSCVYPQSDIYIKAKINGTSLEQDLTTTAVSAPVCTNPESAYSGTVPTSFFTQSGDLYCECGITGYASTIITSNTLPVTGATTTTPTSTSMPTSTPTPRPCQCSWLPCGWKCYYMYIIIVAVVLLVCLVVGLCCCYRRGYFGMGSKNENSREHSHVNKAYTSDTENGQPTRSSGGHREQTLL